MGKKDIPAAKEFFMKYGHISYGAINIDNAAKAMTEFSAQEAQKFADWEINNS